MNMEEEVEVMNTTPWKTEMAMEVGIVGCANGRATIEVEIVEVAMTVCSLKVKMI
jgi:hypothetical protein